MSKRHQRKENNCLNCSAIVYGRFCHICGQENVETRETFWHFVTHFFNDITHFDGQFFVTARYLLTRPGFLSRQYLLGRRMRYVNPIRLYLFTSAVFFLFFFAFVKQEDMIRNSSSPKNLASAKKEIESEKNMLELRLTGKQITEAEKKAIEARTSLLNSDLNRLKTDSLNLDRLEYRRSGIEKLGNSYTSIAAYDSAQIKLPKNKRDGWFYRKYNRKIIELKGRYGTDFNRFFVDLANKFIQRFPQILFVSLPLFALLLQLMYVRRKQFYYTDHGVYALHVYCAMFVLLFMEISAYKLSEMPYLGWLYYVGVTAIIYMFYYVYKSMRTFYQQRRAKTIFKYLLLLFSSFIITITLMAAFGIFSFYTI